MNGSCSALQSQTLTAACVSKQTENSFTAGVLVNDIHSNTNNIDYIQYWLHIVYQFDCYCILFWTFAAELCEKKSEKKQKKCECGERITKTPLTKAMIDVPKNFRHLSHVGHDYASVGQKVQTLSACSPLNHRRSVTQILGTSTKGGPLKNFWKNYKILKKFKIFFK